MRITIEYFKDTGKYYTTGHYEVPDHYDTWEVQDLLMDMLGRPGAAMPGLTGTWRGPLLFRLGESTLPTLILPKQAPPRTVEQRLQALEAAILEDRE